EFLSPIEKYNCTDADATLRIYHKLCSLIPQNLIKFHDTYLAPLIFEVLVPQYIEGFLVDVNYVDKLYSEYSGEDGVVTKYEKNTIQALKQEILAAENFDVDVLKTLYKKECPNLSFKVKSKEDLSSLLENLPINIASPEQLKILYKALGYLRGGDNTVEAPTLKYLVKNKNVKSAEYKLKFQNASKLFTTYIKPIKEMIDKDGFIHGTISAITTESGRLSSNKPNLQNIPADNVIRNCFIARPGYTFLDFDYSGIELRVVTDLADEDTFIDEYLKEDDPDLHWKMAKLIFNIPLEKRPKKENKESIELVRDFLFKNNNFFTQEELKIPSSIKIPTDITDEMVFKAISLFDNRRSFAKTLNFSILYGTTKYGLAKNLHDDFPFVDSDTQNQYLLEAQDLIDLWFKNVPKIKKWLDDTYLFAKKYGYIENRLGRRRWFLFINSNYFQFSSAEKRECWNTPVQSLASDICLSAAIRLKRFFNEHKEDGCRIVNLIHDNIISEVPKHKVDFYLKKKINIMEKEVNVMENGEKILKRVPLKVAVKVSDRWEK
ncbi:MAG: DNA polymerase A family protein, partial [candidate division WOR-3 bacterium]